MPIFFDYEKKAEAIKLHLQEDYNFEIYNYERIKYNIFPLPNLQLENVLIDLKSSEENLSVRGNITILGTPSDDTDATTVSYVTDNFGKSGFPNSSLTTYPTSSDSSATDYHEGSDGIGDFTSADAFNVALINNYDCMEPIGSTTTTDFGSSESHVGG